MDNELLTEDEHKLVSKLGSLMSDFMEIAGGGLTRRSDMREVADHIHALQNMVLSQAAARAYPDAYRLLGQLVRCEEADSDERCRDDDCFG